MTQAEFPAWVRDAVFYQIFPERFANGDPDNDPPGVQPWDAPPSRHSYSGGDLQGILDRLDYIAGLGVTALYLTPIFKAYTNHKYDTADYLAIDPAFGSEELLRHLVAACHSRGLRVVLDAVFNHCGDHFGPFEAVVAQGPNSAYAGWFDQVRWPVQAEPPAYQTCGGAPFLPKLNLHNRAVRDYLLYVARYWIERCNIDGWRLDVPWKAPLDFWQEFRQVVKATRPDAYIVGETWRDTAHWLQGDTCDGVMNYPLRDYILDYAARDTMDAEDFDHFITRLRTVNGPAEYAGLNLLGSHDTPRLLTLCGGNVQRARIALALQFTLPGAPMIYYGDEVGLEGDNDPDCRRTMPWDPGRWKVAIQDTVRCLAQARHRHPALRCGTVEPLRIFNGLYAFRRVQEEDEVIVVANPRQSLPDVTIPLSVAVPETATPPQWIDLLSGRRFLPHPSAGERGNALAFDELPAQSVFVLTPEQ